MSEEMWNSDGFAQDQTSAMLQMCKPLKQEVLRTVILILHTAVKLIRFLKRCFYYTYSLCIIQCSARSVKKNPIEQSVQ